MLVLQIFLYLLIAPEGIEMRSNLCRIRPLAKLLIAPEGIEILLSLFSPNLWLLLIAPEGIEIYVFYVYFFTFCSFNRTRRN